MLQLEVWPMSRSRLTCVRVCLLFYPYIQSLEKGDADTRHLGTYFASYTAPCLLITTLYPTPLEVRNLFI